jgi:hypothetical protein
VLGIGSFFGSIMNSSWAAVKSRFSEMLGSDGSEQFTACAQILFRDTARLYHSFDLFVRAAPKLCLDDELHQKLRLSMARTMIMDNLAFVGSVETCIAFIAQSFLQAADMPDEQCQEIEQSLYSLCQLTNAMIERVELVVQDLCVKNDASRARSLDNILQGLYSEFEHFVQTAGMGLYGENFAVYQTHAA